MAKSTKCLRYYFSYYLIYKDKAQYACCVVMLCTYIDTYPHLRICGT